MPRVGRDLGAAQQQDRIARLRRRLECELRAGVVIAEVDEVEAALRGERRDLVECRRRVAALLGVDVKVALVPAAVGAEHHRIKSRLRLGRQRRGVVERDVDRVVTGAVLKLRLADDDGPPGPGRDRAGQVAARRLRDADDDVLGVAATPAAKPLRAPDAEVEDDLGITVGVADPDLRSTDRHLEGDIHEVATGGGDIRLEVGSADHGGEGEHAPV